VNLADRLRSLDRVQKSRGFRLVGSGVLLALIGIVLAVVVVRFTSGAADPAALAIPEGIDAAQRAQLERQEALLRRIVTASSPVAAAVQASALAAVLLVGATLLGVGLTNLALVALAALVAGVGLLVPGLRPWPWFLAAGIVLAQSFVLLMAAARLALEPAGPVLAVARNVLTEATKQRVSIVFIGVLVILLAALPFVLDPDQPLRYRVQSFLQWSTGGSFWIIALLVLFFSCATVAFEQRDRIIWQTVTKPVAAWQYLVGKWLGVSILSLVLLSVCGAGVLLFTEFLRNQPALGERQDAARLSTADLSEDRMILETQVLTARRVINPVDPLVAIDFDLEAALRDRIEREREQRPRFEPTQREIAQFTQEIQDAQRLAWRAVSPRDNEQFQEFEFRGLQEAKRANVPFTLRYRIDAEGNRPDRTYTLSFRFPGGIEELGRRTGLGYAHNLTVAPEAIADDGTLYVQIYNGNLVDLPNGGRAFVPNPGTITFPADGVQVTYAAGSYRANFLRIMAVLWLKLAFLAAVGVFASTFLSFPVAVLVTAGVFFVGEGAAFVAESVEYFSANNRDGQLVLWRLVARTIADLVSRPFLIYSELRPTARLADGLLLSWPSFLGGSAVLAGASAALCALGSLIFRRRELAMYSGA
jgi:ABC-type transport system involved in multi-copper enzyme maturation permease subunit